MPPDPERDIERRLREVVELLWEAWEADEWHKIGKAVDEIEACLSAPESRRSPGPVAKDSDVATDAPGQTSAVDREGEQP